jgi:hypothetical protein
MIGKWLHSPLRSFRQTKFVKSSATKIHLYTDSLYFLASLGYFDLTPELTARSQRESDNIAKTHASCLMTNSLARVGCHKLFGEHDLVAARYSLSVAALVLRR